MLTGRAVAAEEDEAMGLVAEVVPAGDALARAQALAPGGTRFPSFAMRSDRQSLPASRGLALDAALRDEARLAEEAKHREAAAGAERFARGAGRHGEATKPGSSDD